MVSRRAIQLPALLALIAGVSACSSGVPNWMALRPGVTARTIGAWSGDPEHVYVYPTREALLSSDASEVNTRIARAHDVDEAVTVTEIAPNVVDGNHLVRITGRAGWSGWVIAEHALLPIPPVGVQLEVPAEVNLFPEEDDDDAGVPFGGKSTITLLDFTAMPGNPEYHVRVDSGPLAGQTGYVDASELREPDGGAFILRVP
jgi:hypothetical protein